MLFITVFVFSITVVLANDNSAAALQQAADMALSMGIDVKSLGFNVNDLKPEDMARAQSMVGELPPDLQSQAMQAASAVQSGADLGKMISEVKPDQIANVAEQAKQVAEKQGITLAPGFTTPDLSKLQSQAAGALDGKTAPPAVQAAMTAVTAKPTTPAPKKTTKKSSSKSKDSKKSKSKSKAKPKATTPKKKSG